MPFPFCNTNLDFHDPVRKLVLGPDSLRAKMGPRGEAISQACWEQGHFLLSGSGCTEGERGVKGASLPAGKLSSPARFWTPGTLDAAFSHSSSPEMPEEEQRLETRVFISLPNPAVSSKSCRPKCQQDQGRNTYPQIHGEAAGILSRPAPCALLSSPSYCFTLMPN